MAAEGTAYSMEMHQVRYFLAVCETLNFTRAADRCSVSQPAMTRAIKNLEDELGGPLFHRERANTHLTELGRMMQPYLSEVLAQSESAKTRARDFQKLREAPLSVGIMCTIGPSKLLDLMGGFHRRYPDVNINLREATAQALQDMLAAGEIDVAVFGLPDGIDQERFHTLKLFSERVLIAIPAGHRLEKQPGIQLDDISNERYLFRANCEFADQIREQCQARGFRLSVAYRSERDDWIQTMVKAGLGVTLIPEFAVTVSGLTTRPVINPGIERTVHLVTVRGRPHSPAVGAFVREAMAFDWLA
ncbi:MAG: LysR family transcriptional regulator [Alphaproteobacteria bacterium]|nr:LysR family transcriptional regulator [Alphaproteobacteria bacterium]